MELGDLVIHEWAAQRRDMLMIVVGVANGLVRTRYVYRR